ncbi:ArsR/SmtB family transcription factor [Candidatus Hydrogenedentota bacterium]
MNKKTHAKYRARAKIVKALAHPTRLFIVDQIAEQEKCVRELTDMVGADISTVSKHLSVLKEAGIVSDDKRGLQVYYRLRVPCVLNLFSCIEGVLRSNTKSQLAAME